MIYVQLSTRAKLEMGQTLHIRDIARIIGPKGADQLPLPCPKEQGIWKLTALQVLPPQHCRLSSTRWVTAQR